MVDSKYLVVIKSSRWPDSDVIARIPEQFTLNLESEWESLVSGTSIGESVGKFVKSFTDYSFQTKQTTALVWGGVSPITFNLPLQFATQTSYEEDIERPFNNLMQIAMPTENEIQVGDLGTAAVLSPPGPKIYTAEAVADDIGRGDNISVRIGNIFYMDSMIITSLTYDANVSRVDPNGKPTLVECEIELSTSRALTYNDLIAMRADVF